MERISFNFPSEKLNQLNNYYLENFGYDIYTQIQNFLMIEYEKAKGYSTDTPKDRPRVFIRNNTSNRNDKYSLVIKYTDGLSSQISDSDYILLNKMWNEWSKYKFKREYKDKILAKFAPRKLKNIFYRERKKGVGKYSISKEKGNSKLHYGYTDDLNTALKIKKFLDEHNWDKKYHNKSLINYFEDCHVFNYTNYLLKIIDGELDY